MNRLHNSITFRLALVVGDVIAIMAAYSVAYIIRVKLSDAPIANFVAARPYFFSLLALAPFIVLFFSLIGNYAIDRPQKRTIQVTRVLIGALGAMLFLVTLDYFLLDTIFPAKLVPLYALGLSILFLATSRYLLYFMRWLWWRRDTNRQSVVIIGSSNTARDIATNITRRNSGYRVQAVVGSKRHSFITHETFKKAVQQHTPDVIIQVATPESPAIDQSVLAYSLEHYTQFKFVPSDINNLSDKIELELFMGDIPLLDIQRTALIGWGRLAKRIFDLSISLPALLILSPLLFVIGVINALVFKKVLFKQARLTRGDQRFWLFKFQTVRSDLNGLTPEEAFHKIGKPELIKAYRDNGDFLPNDPRYGAWALFLRKTSLDELPQLWNVVRGDISLVGPRALIPEELDGYDKKHLILNVKSGITGLAQISGRRDLPWDQRRKLDVYYVQNWSFALDIQILFNTAWQVLTGRGAQ